MLAAIQLTPRIAALALPALIVLVAAAMLLFDGRGRSRRRMF
jgi:hypothetical protein